MRMETGMSRLLFRRQQSGMSFPEVAISSFLVVLMTVLTVDMCLLIFACSVNDKACRDVVRAAAKQPTYIKALQFAQTEVKMHKTDGSFVSPIQLVGNTV